MPKGNKNFRPPFIKGGEKSKRAASFWPLSAESGILYTPNTRERVRKQPGGLFSRGNPRLGFPLKDFHIYILPNIHILIFPLKNQRWDAAGNKAEKLFFLQKVFLFAIFPRKIANSLFKNAPFRLGVPLSAESGQGLCAPEPAPKGLSPFGIRSSRESNCKFLMLLPRVSPAEATPPLLVPVL